MRQKLIIISGSPCVGKTTVANKLYEKFNNSAYLDSDWVWCVNPFSIEDSRLRNGDKNVSYVLSNYLNSKFDYVFCSSVIFTDKDIRENILKNIEAKNYDIIGISLMCSEKTLFERHKKRGDNNEVSYYWLRLGSYPGDYIINTDNKNINEIIEEIKNIIIK
ncbi:MAG: AAA family ATPase [Treponema sp.]|jgi:broad-specificity NMP kinase|nr:AAA family ATPase [Treponema sp.]